MVRKDAFTLIELIFAIVIIGITVVSLPMMNQTVAKGTDSNILQEAIFAAVTQLNEATAAHWDEASIDPTAASSYARVIDNALDCNNSASRYRLRPGHINQPLHRRCLDSTTTLSFNSDTNDTIDSLDDMTHDAKEIFLLSTTDATGYKEQYTSELTIPDVNNSAKLLTIVVKKSGKLDTLVKLSTYSFNIGEVDYYKKEY